MLLFKCVLPLLLCGLHSTLAITSSLLPALSIDSARPPFMSMEYFFHLAFYKRSKECNFNFNGPHSCVYMVFLN
jgi:hypothetical protein